MSFSLLSKEIKLPQKLPGFQYRFYGTNTPSNLVSKKLRLPQKLPRTQYQLYGTNIPSIFGEQEIRLPQKWPRIQYQLYGTTSNIWSNLVSKKIILLREFLILQYQLHGTNTSSDLVKLGTGVLNIVALVTLVTVFEDNIISHALNSVR